MRCLTLDEQKSWLEAHDLPPDPYQEGAERFPFYLQFYPPKNLRGAESFMFGLLSECGAGEILLTIADTEQAEPYELRLWERLRHPSEKRSIVSAPAHLFGPEEEEVIAMFALSISLAWEVYLYVPKARTVLLNWEGDIIDFWTADKVIFEHVSQMLGAFGLKETEKGPT